MATSISGTTVTFTDGSTWGGANGGLSPDGNTDRTSQSYNIGHIILANTIFNANQLGFSTGGSYVWALNSVNQSWYTGRFTYPFSVAMTPAVNTLYPANEPRHGSQSYFALGNGNLSGSWRARGMACGAGINQTVGYFVLMERVA